MSDISTSAPAGNAGVSGKSLTRSHRILSICGAVVVGGLFAGVAASASAQVAAPAAPPTIAAWYTSEQAATGERAYNTSCVACHGNAMLGIFSEYDDAAKYFGFVSGSMPADNPGSLPNEDYVAIIAYLMREMGFPAGDTPLLNKREVLLQIQPKASQEALGFVLEAPKP